MGEVIPGWASESFDRTRFDGEEFWLVRWDNGELIEPEKGVAPISKTTGPQSR